MTSSEFLVRLEAFAARHALPVEMGSPVLELGRGEDAGPNHLVTPRGAILARNVVLFGGGENRPRLPVFAGLLPSSVRQMQTRE